MDFDVIVIGGGPGGYLAAERAGHAGLNTLLIEKKSLGGVCLNEGCIPTKTLLNSAKLYTYCTTKSEPYGVSCSAPEIKHSNIIKRKNQIVKMLVSGVQAQMKQNNVKIVSGQAKILEKNNECFLVSVEGEEYRAKNVIIATGSSSILPPVRGVEEGIKSGFIETNRELLDNETIPKSVVVVGGGVIGIEFASYLNAVGCEVTVIELLGKIAGSTDSDISKLLKKSYEKKGIKFILGAKVTAIYDASVEYELNTDKVTLNCERVLMSVGRKAYSEDLGLEKVGALTERGALISDDQCRTNVPGLYAVGDVNGKVMLAHTAYREAECAVNDILGEHDSVEYDLIPSVIYTDPEVGCVGYTEQTAESAGISDIEIIKIPMQYSGRYVVENADGTGICKILFDRQKKVMIGAHIIANHASEFIVACSMLITLRVPIRQMRRLVFPHPTTGEIIREAIHMSKIND